MNTRMNQVLVTVGAAVGVLGLLFGSGLIGQPVQEGFGGAFRATGTLLTPAGAAFSIWGLIYLGLAAFVCWQWVPAHAERPRIRAISVPAALSLALNGVWLAVVQFAENSPAGIWLSVAVIVALEVSLVGVLRKLERGRASDRLEAVLVDGSFGLYFGWTTVAVVANVSAALVASGVRADPGPGQAIGVVVLAVAAVLGVAFALRLGGRLSVAAAMAWGITWIAVGQLTTAPGSSVIAVAAVCAAAVVLVAALWVRMAGRGSRAVRTPGLEAS